MNRIDKGLFRISFEKGRKFMGLFIAVAMISCSITAPNGEPIDAEPQIDPDYSGITLPPNIAPLNFKVNESADAYFVKFGSEGGYSFNTQSGTGRIIIQSKEWRKLLSSNKGKDISIEVSIKKNGKWGKFKTVKNHVANDSIDSHLVYRIISPGFALWHKMGIYQRNLENFDENPILVNEITDNSCMNCHSFCRNSSNTMMFHLRGKLAGTLVRRNGVNTLVNTKTNQTISPAVYPSWHPGGRYLAFSVNQIVQAFHAISDKKIEVLDTLSDLVLFDAEKNVILKSPRLASGSSFETFPSWSPDGRFLYYCNAKKKAFNEYNQIKYDLMRVAFDPVTAQLGGIDTIVSSSRTGMSVSFPRISPDGKKLMFCMSNYGNFSIWHKESDLFMVNLQTNEMTKPDINSDQSESYHQWSSNGKWIVFSSRRIDGLFTRLYFSYIGSDGIPQKPFILPQENPDFYKDFMKSYNIPELVTSEVDLDPHDLYETVRSKPVDVTVKNIN